jgi:hypothetical protein
VARKSKPKAVKGGYGSDGPFGGKKATKTKKTAKG